MVKLNLEPVNKFAIGACKFVGSALLVGTQLDLLTPRARVKSDSGPVDYYDAVNAIVNTDEMLTSYKKEIIDVMKRYADDKYYKTVIAIVTSDEMLSSSKLEIIKKLSK